MIDGSYWQKGGWIKYDHYKRSNSLNSENEIRSQVTGFFYDWFYIKLREKLVHLQIYQPLTGQPMNT